MNKQDAIIVGAGGFGKEMMELVTLEYNLLGFVDDGREGVIHGYKILGKVDSLLSYKSEVNVFICIAKPAIRKKIYTILSSNKNLLFPALISKNTKISKFVNIGQGSIICDNVVITTDTVIKDFCIIDNSCLIGHDDIISEFVTIYPGAIVAGNVEIQKEVEIGTGSRIIQGLVVGNNSILGAGAVVVRDIPNECTAVGIPAKPIIK